MTTQPLCVLARLSMCFVTAASNLRSSIFDIPVMSFHDAKGVAGEERHFVVYCTILTTLLMY